MKKTFLTLSTTLLLVFGTIYSCNSTENEEMVTIKENSLQKKSSFNNKTASKIVAQNENDQKVLDQLFNSETYLNSDLQKWFTNNQSFNLTDYRVSSKPNEDGVDVPIITLIIRNDGGNVIGSLEAIGYKNADQVINFNILLRNFEKLDLSTGNGSVSLTDLNESITYASGIIENKKLVRVENYTTPNSSTLPSTSKRKPADLNGNGDVTFSECFMFMNQAIQSNPDTYTLCYFVGDAIGWVVTGWGPLCQYSVAASCVVISGVY